MVCGLKISEVTEDSVTLVWNQVEKADSYSVYWSDTNLPSSNFKKAGTSEKNSFTFKRATFAPWYFKVSATVGGIEGEWSEVIHSPVKKVFNEQLEKLDRGLIAVKTNTGIFLSWRLFKDEVTGYSDTGLTGNNFIVYKNSKEIARVTDSTNYLDKDGKETDKYSVCPYINEKIGQKSREVSAWKSGSNYLEIPMKVPEGGVTPAGESFKYTINDMSVGDAEGDGEYEFYVKWDPTNSHDVSIKGYTGRCIIDCYKIDGRLLWRLNMGQNIRAGAHYTQFMVYDFDGDGKAEMAVKSAPGTFMEIYNEDGSLKEKRFITIPERDVKKGVTHQDDYVCSRESYRDHLVQTFMNWSQREEVKKGLWPKTLEECFYIEKKYDYPLSKEDAEKLVDYFIYEFAPSRSQKNHLEEFEGFIFEGPEYLTMFSGDGKELDTIDYPIPRGDDGLLWGDYAWPRIEPCNRVDRFLACVAYLDGERPYLIQARGYYTRATVTAYSFFNGKFKEVFKADSGHVELKNPFDCKTIADWGSHPAMGKLAGQGDHTLSTADVDGDGRQEIIFGSACIDHDGSLLYSSYGVRAKDKKLVKFGHGDALHVAKIDPDRPGFQIFNVYEEGLDAPWGFALRDAENGEVIFGEPGDKDYGRCMVGDIDRKSRGLDCWVYDVRNCKGNIKKGAPLPGTDMNIRWAADMTTQIIDGNDIFAKHTGIINDVEKGPVLIPEGMATNNGTKGNPCLVADIFGDWREEIILRKNDDSAIRIYTNTEITSHKLFTLMHDTMYRTGVAWQNNCYNQPCYTKFYFAHDTDWKYVLPEIAESSEDLETSEK